MHVQQQTVVHICLRVCDVQMCACALPGCASVRLLCMSVPRALVHSGTDVYVSVLGLRCGRVREDSIGVAGTGDVACMV